jgi:3-phosphoshikimate 1-carboxyvinyltransferase
MRIERDGRNVRLWPVGPVSATIRPPGSKSLTNRYLTCLALASGPSLLQHAGLCDDTDRMVAGLRALGVHVEPEAPETTFRIHGYGGVIPAETADVDAGSAGTAMRFLTALACLGLGRYTLDGSPRMRERPIGPLVDALHDLGAGIGYAGRPGFVPLTVGATGLLGGTLTFERPPSSQYISAVLMVAPYARRDVYIAVNGGVVSRPYVDMTLDVMRELGVEALENEPGAAVAAETSAGQRFIVPCGQRYRAGTYTVEPDASGATYFWATAAITGGRVRVVGLSRASRQGDVAFVDVLAQMGCKVSVGRDGAAPAAAADFIEVQGPPPGQLRGVSVDLNAMPDTVQTLAVAALFAQGPTDIHNVANLRIKETDRIAALATELTKLGAQVTPRADGLTITPPSGMAGSATGAMPALKVGMPDASVFIDTYDDHRMAMSFALAGLRREGVVIRDADCVSKSFPDYFEQLARL